MPGRATIYAILLFWLGAVGWQLYAYFSAPYTAAPKLIDSLRAAVHDGDSTWKILHNGNLLGTTHNEAREDRSVGYILRQTVTLDGNLESFLNLQLLNRLFQLNLNNNLALSMTTDMQITQFGSLTRLTMNAAVHLDKRQQDGLLRAFISGRADEGQLILSGYFAFADQKFPLPPDLKVRHDQKNLFMTSLAPADCLPGLVGGQAWAAPVIDLGELLKSTVGGDLGLPPQKAAMVQVREHPVWYDWHGEGTACWLVESKQRGLTMSLWVRQTDGHVLRQQAKWGENTIELIRDPKTMASGKTAPKRSTGSAQADQAGSNHE